ncbi:large neutral amino acids transporter small [Elysia marginata]|uniref:Large neutral amino acids transporter small n=1 Tax=Elysia marginata TaxID=1093978 RepID=A0AAV4EAD0_9GAST|nr:large neutral amino acids transporter small [Elysia marginata]
MKSRYTKTSQNRDPHTGSSMKHASPMECDTPKVELKKRINLFHCVSIIVGVIIGAGIFVAPVGITMQVRSVGMSILMWFVVGVFSTLCALCFAELGACLPESGGEYIYIKRAWGDFPAFLCMWMNYLLIIPVTGATSSLVFATYILKPAFPDCDPPREAIQLLAALVVALIVGINCHNVNWVTKLQAVMTGSKLLSLLMVVGIGFFWLGTGNTENFTNSFEGTDFSAGAIAFAFYSGSWAFGGW